MEKIEKMVIDINRKFDVHINMFKAGGRMVVIPDKGHIIDSKKMSEIREYLSTHSDELEED